MRSGGAPVPRRRVPPVAVAAVAVAVVVLALLVRGGDAGPSPALSRRLEQAPDPVRFGFRYEASGTRILDCVRGNRRFVGAVDRSENLLVLSDASDADAFAVVTGSAVFLHRSLFRGGALSAPWMRIGANATPQERGRLTEMIGPDVASYVLAGGLPPSGVQTARAAMEVAREVTPLGKRAVAGTRATGFRVAVDADRFAAETGGSAPSGSAAVPQAPTVDVWLDERDVVVRVDVRPGVTAESAGDEVAAGWSLDYADGASPALPEDIADAVDLAAVDVSALAPAPVPCDVPL